MKYSATTLELCKYRMEMAESTYRMAKLCYDNDGYRDAVNRSYYASFYALRAVLVLEGIDFKRHKDVVAYFNQHYVSTGKFKREVGKRIGRLKTMREDCDYDDFYVIEKDEVKVQLDTAQMVINEVEKYLQENDAILQDKNRKRINVKFL